GSNRRRAHSINGRPDHSFAHPAPNCYWCPGDYKFRVDWRIDFGCWKNLSYAWMCPDSISRVLQTDCNEDRVQARGCNASNIDWPSGSELSRRIRTTPANPSGEH